MPRPRAGLCHASALLLLCGGCNALDASGDPMAPDGMDRSTGLVPGAMPRTSPPPLPPLERDPVLEPPAPDPEPPPEPAASPASRFPMLWLYDGDVAPPHAFEPPQGWPGAAEDAAAVDAELLRSRCHHDDAGNWVCLWTPGTHMAAGPCDFDADGALVASAQVAWPDYRALPQAQWPSGWTSSTVVVRHHADGELDWGRAWHRPSIAAAAAHIAPRGLVVDADGVITWGGQTCDQDAPLRPSAAGGAFGICTDGYMSSVDAFGERIWSWTFGTLDWNEGVSDLRPAPGGGLYVAGTFHEPLQLPGHPDLVSNGGTDLVLMRLDRDHQVSWARTWGSAEHDLNGVRIGVSQAGDVVASASMGAMGTDEGGMLAVLDPEGELIWERTGLSHYITYPALEGEVAITELGDGQLARVGASGEPEPMAAPVGTGISKKRWSVHGTLVIASTSGDAVHELHASGEVLRSHRFTGTTPDHWYQSGLCVGPGGEVGISGTVIEATDFGILDEPVELPAPAGFVLMLRDW